MLTAPHAEGQASESATPNAQALGGALSRARTRLASSRDSEPYGDCGNANHMNDLALVRRGTRFAAVLSGACPLPGERACGFPSSEPPASSPCWFSPPL